MEKRAWWEWGVLGVLIVMFLLSLVPILWEARREWRDGVRREELRAFKQLMEQRNNELGYYPVDLDVSPHRLVVEERDGRRAVSWYLRARLENEANEVAEFDEEYNVYYRVERDNGMTFYDICGGTHTCGLE